MDQSIKLKPYCRFFLLEHGTGFHFSAPPPTDIRSDKYLYGDDVQDVIGSVLAHSQSGNFGACRRLIEIMRQQNDAWVWGCCSTLLSYAAPKAILRELITAFSGKIAEDKD